jgi:RNA polymerase sigma factor (sigma-70 family)
MADHKPAPPPSSAADQAESQASTRTLVERTRKGDRSAGDRLFSRLVKRVRHWARNRVPRHQRGLHDTVDVVQDAAAGVWRNLDRIELEKPGDLEAYVKRAVRNRISDEARKLDRRPCPTDLDSQLPEDRPTALDRVLSDEEQERFRSAMAQLTKDEREMLVARHEYKYSYKDIAVLLQKPTADAVRKSVSRAAAKLAELMRANRE